MKKNTVIRSDSPHTVKMQAGSNVAQRKPAAKDKLHDAQAAPTSTTSNSCHPSHPSPVQHPPMRPQSNPSAPKLG